LATNCCRWFIFARNARITLRSRQQTGEECYGTSADDWNTTFGSTGSEYSTTQVTGSTFLQFRGFRIVDLRAQTAFAVSVKPEVVVSIGSSFARPEVVSSGPDTATPITPSVKEFFVLTLSPLLLPIQRARARIETRLFGRPLQVTVRIGKASSVYRRLRPVWSSKNISKTQRYACTHQLSSHLPSMPVKRGGQLTR